MRSLSRTIVAVLFATAIARAAVGGTVEVTAHDNHGVLLGQVGVALLRLEPGTDLKSSPFWTRFVGGMVARGTTTLDGKLVLENVPPGTYFVSAGSRDRLLLSPSKDEFATPPVVTVGDSGDRVPLELVFTKGDLVAFEAWVNNNFAMGLEILCTEQATHREVREYLNRQGYGEVVLPPGRWEISVPKPPPGYLLQSFERDHMPEPDVVAVLDVAEGGNTTRFVWKYGAPCHVYGRVSWDGAQRPAVQVVATLERAGAWLAAAEARGGSSFRRVPAGIDENGLYDLYMQDGLWRIEVVGPRIVSRSPESVSLELVPGDERTQDFRITVEPAADDGSTLFVTVRGPGGRALAGASVAVWSCDATVGDVTGKEPVRTARTEGDYGAAAKITGLPKGKYLVAAGHPDYVEARSDPFDFEPKPDVADGQAVTLGAGAVVRAHAMDENRKHADGVDLVIDRMGEAPRSLVADPDLDAKRASRRGTTDASGWTVVGGLDPARYRARPVLTGPRAQTHVARIADGDGPLEDDIELTLAGGEKKELRVVLSRAAGIRAQLGCSDRAPIPRAVAFRIIPFPFADPPGSDPEKTDSPDPDLGRLAILAKQDVALTGKSLDTLTAGPLSEGTFLLAVRPAGHDRWTYEGDTEDVARAVPMSLDDGKIADGGFLEIDCGPTVRLRPVVGSHDPLPDLRQATVQVKAVRAAKPDHPPPNDEAARGPGASAAGESRQPLLSPAVERALSRITLRKLPEDTVRIDVTVSHDFFVPGTIHATPVVLALERGRESEVTIPVPEIGGVLEVDAGEAWGAVVTDAAGKERRAPADAGLVRIPSLGAGAYAVRLCADPECARTVRTWESVPIAPAQVARLH